MENKPGALMRVAGVLTSRGYNIESLTVAKTLDPTLSSMTIVAEVSEENSDLLIEEITRLVDVVKAVDLDWSRSAVQRELALVKVSDVKPEMCSALTRGRRSCARIVDVADALHARGDRFTTRIDASIELLHHYGNVEMIRSGSMAMARMPNNRLPMPTFRMDSDVPDIAPVETN
ncbi:MAG: acetolactate synthase small subunit [Bryobacterales bacterium]